MIDDILAKVRAEILNEDQKSLPWVPKHLDKTWEMQAGIAGALAGIWAGVAFGAHMGLAGPWGAIAGTVPCAIVGGVIGYLTGAKIGSNIHRDKPFLTDAGDWSAPAMPAATARAQQIADDSGHPSNGASKCAPASSVTFVRRDKTTKGRWKGVYGADGYNVINATGGVNYPAYATMSVLGKSSLTWNAQTVDCNSLEWPTSSWDRDRIAACWYAISSFTIDINLTDGKTHQIALHCMAWEWQGRSQTVQVQDAMTGRALDTQSLSSFVGGVYLVWNVRGHVKFVITQTGGPDAVVSGIFFS